MRRRCGYGLLYEISKSKKKSAPSEAQFLDYIQFIELNYPNKTRPVRGAMLGSLIGIGKRSIKLNSEAMRTAKNLQKLNKDTTYHPRDVIKHLTNDYIINKLGLK